ncbi:MAG TPA: hypothetical protein VE974_01410 [Thermoanaerobaculia bacterium]|nr:hypothetical protein [Thermoanaerobaculia bacterium]
MSQSGTGRREVLQRRRRRESGLDDGCVGGKTSAEQLFADRLFGLVELCLCRRVTKLGRGVGRSKIFPEAGSGLGHHLSKLRFASGEDDVQLLDGLGFV